MVIPNIAFAVLAVVILQGCTNPFATRPVEKPDADKYSDIFEQPTSSEVVLSNFRYALIQKNVSNYMSCFIDTSLVQQFKFTFNPDESIPSERFQNWSLQDEETYLRNVFSRTGTVQLEYIDKNISITPISSSLDSVQTTPFAYQLKITMDETKTYSGIARMKLIKNSNSLWSIYYWEDTRDNSDSSVTWSTLKATYRFN
jgi:hypothetical protein